VREAAAEIVKSGGAERLQVGVRLLERSVTARNQALGDDSFVESMIASLQEDPEDMLMDPLLLTPLKDPVVLSSGFVVDRRSALHENGRMRLQRCPFSRQELQPMVYPLVFLREKVKAWKLERLDKAIQLAEEFLAQNKAAAVVRVIEIAEEFLDEVGDETYIHKAKRLADVERRAPQAGDPARILRMHQRIVRVVTEDSQLQELVCEAVDEFVAGARKCLQEGDAEAAGRWLGRDVCAWLDGSRVRPLWAARVPTWQEVMLRVAKQRGDDSAIWKWRLATLNRLRQSPGPGEDAEAWLRAEGLSGQEPELSFNPPGFDPGLFDPAAEWEDPSIGLAATTGRSGIRCLSDLSPRPGCDWFLEVVFTVTRLRSPSYLNTVFSQHGAGTGWEVRVDADQGIEFIFTTGSGHNERFSNFGSDCGDRWTHVAVAFLAGLSEIRVFVNGAPATPYAVHGEFRPAQEMPRLGQNPCWNDRGIAGKVAHANVSHSLPAPLDGPEDLGSYVERLSEYRLSRMPPRDYLPMPWHLQREDIEEEDDDYQSDYSDGS